MVDSDSESTVEEADSSSSCSPSSNDDGSHSDFNASSNKSTERTPNQRKVSKSENTDTINGTDTSFENTLQYSLKALQKIKNSSNKEEELWKFYEWYKENIYQLTPEQAQKVKHLNIEMEDIEDDRVDTFEYKSMAEMFIPFSQEEIDVLKENWICFCEDYGFDPSKDAEIFFRRPRVKEKQKRMFKHYISQHLNRRIDVVQEKFMELYSRRREEKFLPEEDELLLTWNDVAMKGKGKNRLGGVWVGAHFKSSSLLARILQRPMPTLISRLRFLLKNLNSPARLSVMPKRAAQRDPLYLDDIRNCKMDEYPDWTKNEETWEQLAKADGQSTVKQLKKSYFRELYPSVKSSSKRTTAFKNLLIEKLSFLKDPTWENVDWKELGKTCFNVGAVRVYSVMRLLTKRYVPKEQWSDLKAAVQIIATNWDQQCRYRRYRRKKQFINNYVNTLADVEDSAEVTGVSSDGYQGPSGEIQGTSALFRRSHEISSKHIEPDCESDIDDPDIMTPIVEYSEGPSEIQFINNYLNTIADSEDSIKGTGESSEGYQGPSGEIQGTSGLFRRSHEISSKKIEPDCESDIDDPDIMTPIVEYSEGPSEIQFINNYLNTIADSEDSIKGTGESSEGYQGPSGEIQGTSALFRRSHEISSKKIEPDCESDIDDPDIMTPIVEYSEGPSEIHFINNYLNTIADSEDSIKGTGESSEGYQGPSGEIQGTSALFRRSHEISSKKIEPDCESDIDDPDIITPIVEYSEGPYENSYINGISGSTPGSHQVPVAMNYKAVPSRKKRSERLGKSRGKEKSDGYGNILLENEESQEHTCESSHDVDDRVASYQSVLQGKQLEVEIGNVKINGKNRKGERQKRRDNTAKKRKTSKRDWETADSLLGEISTDKESPVVAHKKLKRRKKRQGKEP